MKPVLNTTSLIKPGMKIKLINGKNVNIGGRPSYDWDHEEIVEEIEGEIIHFKDCPIANWFTVDMPWEVEE